MGNILNPGDDDLARLQPPTDEEICPNCGAPLNWKTIEGPETKERQVVSETDAYMEWTNSEEGIACGACHSQAELERLRNRLWRAFCAGVSAGKKIREEEIMKRLIDTFTGRQP